MSRRINICKKILYFRTLQAVAAPECTSVLHLCLGANESTYVVSFHAVHALLDYLHHDIMTEGTEAFQIKYLRLFYSDIVILDILRALLESTVKTDYKRRCDSEFGIHTPGSCTPGFQQPPVATCCTSFTIIL